MRNSFSLGTIFGIGLRADLSWAIAFILLVWMLIARDNILAFLQTRAQLGV